MTSRDNSEFIDVRSLLRQYRKNWCWFVISIIVCGALAYGFTKIRQQPYAVIANLLIAPDETDITNPAESLSSLFGSKGQVDDEIFIVSSHSLYCKVAKELGINVNHTVRKNLFQKRFMFEKYPVAVRTNPEIYDTLSVTLDFRVKINDKGKAYLRAKMDRDVLAEAKNVTLPYTVATPYGEFTFFLTEYYVPGKELTTDISVSGYHSTAEMLNEIVTADIASKLSNVIQLRMETPYVTYGKAVLNKIIELYNERGIQESASQNELTVKFLDARLEVIAHDLSMAERELQTYKEQNGIVDVEHETKYQSTRRAQIDEELVRAQTAMNIITMIRDFISDPAHRYKMIPALGLSEELAQGFSESLSEPLKTYNALVNKRIELIRSAKPGNRQLQILEEQIDAQQANLISSINQAQAEATRSMIDLQSEMERTQGYLATVPNQEREYISLARQNEVKQALYLYMLQKREEISMLIAKNIPKGQIIDQAYTLKEPIGMKKVIIWLVGLVLGAMIVPVVLYLRQLIRNRFESRREVERSIEVPVLGEICTDNSGKELIMASGSDTPAAEMFRLLRSNILFVMNNPNDRIVMVTSGTSGEGKSFVAINLAAAIAQMGKRVLLAGMDIRRPQLARYLGVQPSPGLTQYLVTAGMGYDRIIQPVPQISGMDVIVAGPVAPNPSELLLSSRVDELFTQLRNLYDYIVIDSAPVGMISDTFALNRIADATIFVCRANFTRLNDLAQVDTINEKERLKKLTVVVNGTEPVKSYGYGSSQD